ncbi:sigma factor-like helix-turn-helix DNA-binding protein [Paenibacillus sp. VCA1]|uniref:sigma factor-like helix-turn-helix DNA-binding protein n=1 Tax=Paenibacillus sp. VCA1 TaxID=3039148 RepID=UPI002872489E|nr:sigma factor-like helix-turn-helix DNA-binding protein [Paenibacillus sp. VCA1]MDR9852916.1 sigma factor-like helix-turn-helix DNA-binding protein [Paenibacillus sp. VCA1]
MGAVKVDTEKQTRAYEVKYALNDVAGVKALLRDRHRIAERRFRGDTAASDIIIDLHSAIESAGLTERQAEAIAWVYGRDLTQKTAAAIMGIAQQNVAAAVDRAAEAIASVFKRWEYGEITVEFEVDDEEAA